MKLSIAKYYPAHSSNYTKGRGRPIKQITVHHTAGFETTLRHLWGNPARNGSSHFFVHPDYIEQYVDTDDTAWTNSYWPSNQESITIETRGDWRGYHDQKTLNQLQKLFYHLRKAYPHVTLTFHMDEAQRGGKTTLCPADLKHKGYAKQAWDKATAQLNPQATTPKPAAIKYTKIPKTEIKMKRTANLWDFNATTWAQASKQKVKTYGEGHVIEDVQHIATNALGGRYYVSDWSMKYGKTWGVNIVDADKYKVPVPKPTPVEPKPIEDIKPPEPKPVDEPEVVLPLPEDSKPIELPKEGEEMEETTNTKPGVKTTEFWLTFITNLVALVNATFMDSPTVVTVTGLILAVLATLGYTASRTMVKK